MGMTQEERLQWWHEARFGMFIHWGLYSILAGEWKGQKTPGLGEWIMHDLKIPIAEYEKLAAAFNPVKFDAEAWAELALQAGMKYLIRMEDRFRTYRVKWDGFESVRRVTKSFRSLPSRSIQRPNGACHCAASN